MYSANPPKEVLLTRNGPMYSTVFLYTLCKLGSPNSGSGYNPSLQGILLGTVPGKASTKSGPPDQFSDVRVSEHRCGYIQNLAQYMPNPVPAGTGAGGGVTRCPEWELSDTEELVSLLVVSMMYQKSVPIARTKHTKLRTPKEATNTDRLLKVSFILSAEVSSTVLLHRVVVLPWLRAYLTVLGPLCWRGHAEVAMDQVTFRSDTVLSDVHVLLPNSRHLMARLNGVGQPVPADGAVGVEVEGHQAFWTCDYKPFILVLTTVPPHTDSLGVSTKTKAGLSCVVQPSADGAALTGGLMEGTTARWRSVMVVLGQSGTEIRPGLSVFVSKFRILREAEQVEVQDSVKSETCASLDDDGDLDVIRKPTHTVCDREKIHPVILSQAGGTVSDEEEDEEEEAEEEDCAKDVIKIEHTMATPLEDVGKQIWRGAFLLSDFILSHPNLFRDATVLELGAGTGLTSIIMAHVAKTVYCTDVGEDLLSMCQRNVAVNSQYIGPAAERGVKVRQLDWAADDFLTDTDAEFGWSEEEVADLHDNTTLVIAADVCYDDHLTDALFRTLYRITSNLRNPSTAYFSIEKRLNFTLRHMDVSCEAYDHFRLCLEQLADMNDGKMKFTVEPVPCSFPQFFQYERVDQLVRLSASAVRWICVPSSVDTGRSPQDAAPRDAAPRDAALQDAAPQDAAPQDAAPQDAVVLDSSETSEFLRNQSEQTQKSLEHPHTVPADGAVGVEVEGHQAFWTCDDKPFISVLTTAPPHTDSLGVSTKTKAGLVTEDDPLPF
ncbi:hypothetical protein NFI96_018204 [Prochilodus magdalenae]|nr:hypothetical protein NFI96_018204 [Prochilodus magdalenae]